MVCELGRVLRECDGFFYSISVIYLYTTAATVVKKSYFVSVSYIDSKPMK